MVTERYEEPGGRWAIRVPASWLRKVGRDGSGLGEVAFLITRPADPVAWEDDPEVDLLGITVELGTTLEAALIAWRASVAHGHAVAVSERVCNLAGHAAYEVVMDGTGDGVTRRLRCVVASVGDALYSVVHVAGKARYVAEELPVSMAIATFELLPGATGSDFGSEHSTGLSDEGRRLYGLMQASGLTSEAGGDPHPTTDAAVIEAARHALDARGAAPAPDPVRAPRIAWRWAGGYLVVLVAMVFAVRALIHQAGTDGTFSSGGNAGDVCPRHLHAHDKVGRRVLQRGAV